MHYYIIIVKKILFSILIFLSFTLLFIKTTSAIDDDYFSENFNDNSLDSNKWELFENGGVVNINSGFLELSSTPFNNFPYIRTRNNPFPIDHDFILEFRIQFPVITAFGVGFLTGFEAPPNEIPYNDLITSRIFTYHADTSKATFWFRYLQQNIFSPLAPIDNNFHIIKVIYQNSVYKYFFDEVKIFETISSFMPRAIYYGSPHNQKVLNSSSPWTSMKLDYIKVIDIATPSATPTPTPTPLPPSKKVVIVPGMTASWNADAILNCKGDNYKGNWKLAFYAEKFYKPLYTVLSDEGYTIKPYYYDWRKNVTSHRDSLSNFIHNFTSSDERINLLGHSMGGLLGRSYLEYVTTQNRLSKFLSIGSPHRGASNSYPVWSGGELWERNLLYKIGMTLAIKECEHYNIQRKTIQKYFPSIQNLLRIDDYLRNNATGQLKNVTTMKAQNNWLPTSGFIPPFYGVTVGSLSGVDQKTLDIIRVKKRSALDATLGNWEDGKPVSKEFSYGGDGTVLTSSSDIPGSIIKHIPQNHTNLIHSADGYEAILSFLNPLSALAQIPKSIEVSPTSALIIIADPAHIEAFSPAGESFSSDEGTLAIYNPKSGNYKLQLKPKSANTRVIIAQFLEDERVLWKEYNLAGSKAMQKSLLFNPLNPQEDALR